jgi:hypothetical protein
LRPQAGLALALSLLFGKILPEFGAGATALTPGVVAINELVAPASYRYALLRSGDAGKKAEAATLRVGEVTSGVEPTNPVEVG